VESRYRFEDGDARDYIGDDDGTVNGATYLSSGGVTDPDTGANSGAFEGDGNNDYITFPKSLSTPHTLSMWVKLDVNSPTQKMLYAGYSNGDKALVREKSAGGEFQLVTELSGTFYNVETFVADTNWHLHTVTVSDTSVEYFIDANSKGSVTSRSRTMDSLIALSNGSNGYTQGVVDDLIVTNSVLTSSEITDIYNATKP
jgi:hypothetical protein